MKRVLYLFLLFSAPVAAQSHCPRVEEEAAVLGSDLVVDGLLTCESNEGDCHLEVSTVVHERIARTISSEVLHVDILREEAQSYSEELRERNMISFCYPARLWYPSAGTYQGRFYLNRTEGGSYQMAFRPKLEQEL